MITREEALRVTEVNFPNGPEALADQLAIPYFAAPLQGFEGWCAHAKNTIIAINSNSTKSRQRFTLAHELAHLVMGTESDIYCRPFCSDNTEEKAADGLAAEFLIPWPKLIAMGGDQLPVVANTVNNIAKAANVSPVVGACRIASSCERLGLMNAAVVFIKGGSEVWRYSSGLQFTSEDAIELANEISSSAGTTVRKENAVDENLIVGSLIDCWDYQLLLAQLLPPAIGNQEAQAERVERIRKEIFNDDMRFEGKASGSLGAIKNKSEITSLDAAVAMFYSNYIAGFSDEQREKLSSDDGQLFVRARLSKWFS